MFKLFPKLEQWWLMGFLILIPTQLGKFFWPEWSQVMGIRIDYLSPVLYLIDLVWLGLVIFRFQIKNLINFQNLLVTLFVIVNIYGAENREIAIYKWLRIGQWWWFYTYCKENKQLVKETVLKVIPWWIGMESLLGLAQVVKGGSLQGIWYWLGERRFDFSTIGIAQFSVWGEGLVRAYGTFSHPNSLAGFLLVSLIFWGRNPPPAKAGTSLEKGGLHKVGWWVVVWLGLLGIVLTGSRTVWGLLVAQFLFSNFKFLIIEKKKLIGYVVVGCGGLLMALSAVQANYRLSDFVGGWDTESISKRMDLNISAMEMIKNNWMFGVGAGNFLVKLPEYMVNNNNWLQPVHNIFLLIGAEIGVAGMIILGWRLKIKSLGWLFLLIVVTGLMDHYWITLPQNTWLLAIVLAVWQKDRVTI